MDTLDTGHYRCCKCHVVKPLSDYYKNSAAPTGHQAYCKPCHKELSAIRHSLPEIKARYKARWKYVDTTCKDCGAHRERLKFTLAEWSGRCRACSNREAANRPEAKSSRSARSRDQALRRGGVPNANKFTSEMVRGSANHNWKGGITSEEMRIRGSKEYALWKRSVFERDNHTCQLCLTTEGRMEADHIKAFARYPEIRLDLSNGRTLCRKCHRRETNQMLREYALEKKRAKGSVLPDIEST